MNFHFCQDDCPNHSEDVSGHCKCKEGYITSNSLGSLKREVIGNEFCTLAFYAKIIKNEVVNDEIVLAIDIGDDRQSVKDDWLTYEGPADEKPAEAVQVYRISNELDNPLKIELDETRITFYKEREGMGTKITIAELKPGVKYRASILVTSKGDPEATNRVVFPIVPSCSCDAFTNPDKTGRPKDLLIYQDKGHVLFNFKDNSRCENSFSFSRFVGLPEFLDDSVSASSFTNDFIFASPMQCGATVSPESVSKDDLKLSRLSIGDSYSYCVRATNLDGYMDLAVNDEEKRVLFSSTGLCSSHRISWEASIDGKVTTEQNAGSLPIRGVKVTWQLLSEDGLERLECASCSDSTETDEGGAFSINLNVDHPSLKGTNSADIPISLKYSKTTSSGNNTIDHIFLCNGGEEFCDTTNGNIVFLKHLHFEQPHHVYDDTSVLFSGKISVEGTGCTINEAEVCIEHKSTRGTLEELICVDTDSKGLYEAPVVIGSVIHNIDVRYHRHKFAPTFENKILYSRGFLISSEGFYAYNDFMDISKGKTIIEGMYHCSSRYNLFSYYDNSAYVIFKLLEVFAI